MRHSIQKFCLSIPTVLLAIATLSVIIYGGLVFFSQSPEARAATQELHGWAWSSNIGWVGFNCEDVSACAATNYKVLFDDVSGNLSGHAWSSNIGWINFAPDLTGAPDGAGSARVSNLGTGQVVGWARACSVFDSGCSGALKSNAKRGDWDGWIKMSGANHISPCLNAATCPQFPNGGVTYDAAAGTFKGFAWGSDVIGWLNFDQVTLTIPPPPPNLPPVANAGPNQTVTVGALVGLNGSASSDPDGDPLTFSWSFTTRPVGSTATLSSPSSVMSTFTADVAGTYQIRLTVSDGALSDFDDVAVSATPLVPGTFTLSCADIIPPPDTDPPCDIRVDFSPALKAKSTEATITITPQGGFTGGIVFTVLEVRENSTGILMSPSRYRTVYVCNGGIPQPTCTATSPYIPVKFKLDVDKIMANPKADRIFTVQLRADGGIFAATQDLRLTLKATSPGFGEQ